MEGVNLSLHKEIINTTKSEAFVVIATIRYLQPFLQGRSFIEHGDHQALWLLRIQQVDWLVKAFISDY